MLKIRSIIKAWEKTEKLDISFKKLKLNSFKIHNLIYKN